MSRTRGKKVVYEEIESSDDELTRLELDALAEYEGDDDGSQVIVNKSRGSLKVTIAFTDTNKLAKVNVKKSSLKDGKQKLTKTKKQSPIISEDGDDNDDADLNDEIIEDELDLDEEEEGDVIPVDYDDDDDEEEEEQEENHSISDMEEYNIQPTDNMESFYQRPTPGQSLRQERPLVNTHRSASSNSITQTYREKTNAAEPALVTMHQTATDINTKKGDNSTLFNHIATWAASYLWPNNIVKSPSPQASVSTSIIPSSTAAAAAIPIERHYVPPTSSNASSL